jgi:hypothetical protein
LDFDSINELKRRILQGSTAPNSLLNATSTASADKDNAGSADLQDESENSSEIPQNSAEEFSLSSQTFSFIVGFLNSFE